MTSFLGITFFSIDYSSMSMLFNSSSANPFPDSYYSLVPVNSSGGLSYSSSLLSFSTSSKSCSSLVFFLKLSRRPRPLFYFFFYGWSSFFYSSFLFFWWLFLFLWSWFSFFFDAYVVFVSEVSTLISYFFFIISSIGMLSGIFSIKNSSPYSSVSNGISSNLKPFSLGFWFWFLLLFLLW